MEAVTLGERIRRAREAKGWTVNELDRRIRASTGYSSRVERGERKRLPPDRIAAYARELGLELSELVGEPSPNRSEGAKVERVHPNLEAAIASLGRSCTPGAAEVARRMGHETPVDLEQSDWTVLLLDLSKKI